MHHTYNVICLTCLILYRCPLAKQMSTHTPVHVSEPSSSCSDSSHFFTWFFFSISRWICVSGIFACAFRQICIVLEKHFEQERGLLVYTLQYKLCIMYFGNWSVFTALHSGHCIVLYLMYLLYCVLCVFRCIVCILCALYCTVYRTYYAVYCAHCTYTVCCAYCIVVQFILYVGIVL